ncbi:HNH endonuclease family protein [Actinomadura rudentiformis]|uniref:HNH endonuclease n=1 Tax=Actinomadura rudentiformis TaxID=359158 RepID=A0A6H9YS15_9ACTN|nr:HNH endonuclease family protein [Actinomadura rudentiformis]KAB2346788.1 HNH endonuclease [Actinomadura rudentiformis]
MKRTGIVIAALGTTVLTSTVVVAPSAYAAPPTPPGKAVSAKHLSALRVAKEGSLTGYDRRKFPHWSTVKGACNTRETVLKRDGSNVRVNAKCAAISGTWKSPYDGATWRKASDVDIDHMVALAEAWRSGARSWTTKQRTAFANDRASSQLWAVTDNVNQAKGDKDPAKWLPPRASFRCMYARSWIDVKWRYKLTVDTAEKKALTRLLRSC